MAYVRGGLAIPIVCAQCGTTFVRSNGPQKRCDQCRTLECAYCHKQFISPNNRVSQRYCSLSCKAKGDTEAIERINKHRGIKPRTYHLRHRDKHGGAADVEWRTAVFARDDYTCQACGAKGGRLQAHHIEPYKERPDLRHDLSNGQTLCVDCHRKTDSYGWGAYWRRRKKIAAKRLMQSVMVLA